MLNTSVKTSVCARRTDVGNSLVSPELQGRAWRPPNLRYKLETRYETLDASIPKLGIVKLDLTGMRRLAEEAMNNREAMPF